MEEKKLKIVHIQQYYNEGLGYQENLLPAYQSNYGHHVVMITSDLSPDYGFNKNNRKSSKGKFIENGFTVLRIPIKGEFKGRFVIFSSLYQYLEEEKPDYIFHHGVTSPSLFTIAKYKKNNPNTFIAVDNHADWNIAGKKKAWLLVYYRFFWKNVLKIIDPYIDVYFGVTPARNLFLEEELGVKKNKIKLLPIGADLKAANNANTSFREKYNIPKDHLVITTGGKITKNKSGDILLKAFKQIKTNKINLIVFGKVLDPTVIELIKSDDRIIEIPWLNREDIFSLYKEADIGIWNSQHTTLIEDAVASGLPLILRYHGSTCHLINESGLFLFDNSVKAVYEALMLLLSNPVLLDELRNKTKVHAEKLSYEAVARESINYFENQSAQPINNLIMNDQYIDLNNSNFRKIFHKKIK